MINFLFWFVLLMFSWRNMRLLVANCRLKKRRRHLYIKWGYSLQIVLLLNLGFGISWGNSKNSRKAQEKLYHWNKYINVNLKLSHFMLIMLFLSHRLLTNLQQKLRISVYGYVMIHGQVHTTCTVNTETPLLLAPSLNAIETWVQDIELELMLSRYELLQFF